MIALPSGGRSAVRLLVLLAALVLAGAVPVPALAQDEQTTAGQPETPSGLPIPRFVTTRSSPINVRMGPGTRYGVAWVYLKPGTPVEIVQEFDTWRKIRDYDGSEGWVHQNLLSGKRAGLVAPWRSGEQVALRDRAADDGGVRAFLPAGFKVDIDECDGKWCEVSAVDHPPGGGTNTYSGYVPQPELWGVYDGEVFD